VNTCPGNALINGAWISIVDEAGRLKYAVTRNAIIGSAGIAVIANDGRVNAISPGTCVSRAEISVIANDRSE